MIIGMNCYSVETWIFGKAIRTRLGHNGYCILVPIVRGGSCSLKLVNWSCAANMLPAYLIVRKSLCIALKRRHARIRK